MKVDENEKYCVRAKTGVVGSVTPKIAWYVGYLETKDDVWFFACNIDYFKTVFCINSYQSVTQ